MTLTIGVDTYVDVDKADSYISSHYTSADKQRKTWEALWVEDKKACLRNAVVEMEQLIYTGRKHDVDQVLAFPRLCDAVPKQVEHAQIEEALELASPTEATDIANTYCSGVKSYSIGQLSETFKACDTGGIQGIIKSPKAQRLLLQFMGGGFIVS